jgi:Stress responsive A/B Barrel Domain
MVVHLVLFRPRASVSEAEKQAMLDAVAAAAAEIPSVRRFAIGSRLQHGAAYEQMQLPDFPFVAIVEFENMAGLKAYLDHPKHEDLGRLFYQLQEAALVYDYELAPARKYL